MSGSSAPKRLLEGPGVDRHMALDTIMTALVEERGATPTCVAKAGRYMGANQGGEFGTIAERIDMEWVRDTFVLPEGISCDEDRDSIGDAVCWSDLRGSVPAWEGSSPDRARALALRDAKRSVAATLAARARPGASDGGPPARHGVDRVVYEATCAATEVVLRCLDGARAAARAVRVLGVPRRRRRLVRRGSREG